MLKVTKFILSLAAFALGICALLNGTSVTASAAENLSVKLDRAYLEYAVVSELPVELSARVLDQKGNYIYGKELSFSVEEGGVAEIREGKYLYVLKEGSFTVKAALAEDETVFDSCECTAVKLTFTNVRILSRIENVTVYTQPILLTGSVVVDGMDFPEDVHYELAYEVVSGPAYISVGQYLYFTGEGTVVLKAYSRYDKSSSATLEIPVTDPDKGLDFDGAEELKQGRLESSDGGFPTLLVVGCSVGGLLCIAAVVCVVVIKSKSKKH